MVQVLHVAWLIDSLGLGVGEAGSDYRLVNSYGNIQAITSAGNILQNFSPTAWLLWVSKKILSIAVPLLSCRQSVTQNFVLTVY